MSLTKQEIEELGRELAKKLDWDGIDILRATAEALTDSNFHHEAGIIEKMGDVLDETDAEAHFELTVKK